MDGGTKVNDRLMDRRTLLRMLGLAGGGAILAAAAAPLTLDRNFRPGLHLVRQTRLAMGTFVEVTVLDSSADRAEEAVAGAFEEMRRVESLLSRFEPGSAVGVLNGKGRLAGPPPELSEVLDESERLYRWSGGVFDVTILPLVEALRLGLSAGRSSPDVRLLDEASRLVGLPLVRRNPEGLAFSREGMAVTLDGLAKGYVVDRGIGSLARSGIGRAMINAGGDIRALGGRPDGGWRVAVKDPFGGGAPRAFIRLTDGAVATSGLYEVYYDEDKLFGHITRPDLPENPPDMASATVTAPTCLRADGAATAAFALGPDEGGAFVSACSGLGALLVDRRGGERRVRFHARG